MISRTFERCSDTLPAIFTSTYNRYKISRVKGTDTVQRKRGDQKVCRKLADVRGAHDRLFLRLALGTAR
jgi:hypothetical protein